MKVLLIIMLIIIGLGWVWYRNREHLGEHVGYYSRVNNTLLADEAGVFNNIQCTYNDATNRVHCVNN